MCLVGTLGISIHTILISNLTGIEVGKKSVSSSEKGNCFVVSHFNHPVIRASPAALCAVQLICLDQLVEIGNSMMFAFRGEPPAEQGITVLDPCTINNS